MNIINKAGIPLALILVLFTSCNRFVQSPAINSTEMMQTAISVAKTEVIGTQLAIPTSMPTPSLSPTSTFIIAQPRTSPSAILTPTSPYEADHEEIKKVIASYFEHIYSVRNTFQLNGFGDTVSTSDEAEGFLKTELRKQAVGIAWARINFLRFASYQYTLDYSEIVVFDAGQRARVNFTEGNAIVYELSIPYEIVSRMSGVNHIMILQNEQDGWKIIYDVHDDYSHRSLYAPTPIP